MKFTKEQLMLSFSYMAYYGFDLTGSDSENAQKILADIQQALRTWEPVKDDWEVVWGPGIFAFHGDKFDDNLMYVVKNRADPDRYVIAIRGTNPVSLKDWLWEDFNVGSLIPWAYGNPGSKLKPKISHGTYCGLTRLQEMKAEKGVPGEGKTLLAFLSDELDAGRKQQLCVTGHSLGGALAPTLALWLKDIQGTTLPESTEISTVAFAGPSAGNKDFATYSDERLGDQCVRVANSLDVVPYAWNTRSLGRLYFLYMPHFLLPGPILTGLFTGMIATSFRGRYQQIKKDAAALEGGFKPLLYNYSSQAIYQHVVGYPEIMGMLNDDAIPLGELFPRQLAL